MQEIKFEYDEELDSYVLKSDKRIIIDTGTNDLVMFSRNQVIQTSQKLYLNPVPFYKYTGDMSMFQHTMESYLKQRQDELPALFAEHHINHDGSVCVDCGVDDNLESGI